MNYVDELDKREPRKNELISKFVRVKQGRKFGSALGSLSSIQVYSLQAITSHLKI
jgi:hypothetical protein